MSLRSRWLRVTVFILALVAAGVLVVPSVLSALTPRLVFRPLPLTGAETKPGHWGLRTAHEVRFSAADGIQVHGWWVPAERDSACGAAIIFHGRSANISTRAGAAAWLAGLGYDVLLFDYRGYGASDPVAPTEAGLYLDSEAAYAYVSRRRAHEPEQLILLGQSMGAVMAAHVAAERRAAGLVLVSPYTSAPGFVRSRLPPWIPGTWPDWHSRNRFDVQARVNRSRAALAIAASRGDEQVPYRESLALYTSAPGPKVWIEVDSLRHNGLLQSAAMQERLEPVLPEMVPCGGAPPA
jgi:alpha-beta hydrolase superfamily lysophospholipase